MNFKQAHTQDFCGYDMFVGIFSSCNAKELSLQNGIIFKSYPTYSLRISISVLSLTKQDSLNSSSSTSFIS